MEDGEQKNAKMECEDAINTNLAAHYFGCLGSIWARDSATRH